MQNISIPITELALLAVNQGVARISPDNKHAAVVIDNVLHVLVGDFTGVDTTEKLSLLIAAHFASPN